MSAGLGKASKGSLPPDQNQIRATARSVSRAPQRANRPSQTGSYGASFQPGLWDKRNESPRPRPTAGEGTGGYKPLDLYITFHEQLARRDDVMEPIGDSNLCMYAHRVLCWQTRALVPTVTGAAVLGATLKARLVKRRWCSQNQWYMPRLPSPHFKLKTLENDIRLQAWFNTIRHGATSNKSDMRLVKGN
ncbi:unnamed protein product [Spodoptera exigua]|nr:unnamed protein product [Spodoptera exigua]